MNTVLNGEKNNDISELGLFCGGNTRVLFDMLGEGAYCVDRDRRILHWNCAAEKITGFMADEVLGKHCYANFLQHVDGEGRELCTCNDRCPLYLTMSDGETREGRVSLLHKDGRRVPVKIKTVPMLDPAGVRTGALELFHEEGVVDNLREQVGNLTRKAHIDCLTGLPNRHSIEAHLRQSLDEWERYNWSFASFISDIDNFK